MDKEIWGGGEMLSPFKKRRRKGKEKAFTIRTAMEKQPQHFGWHQAALLKCQAGVYNKIYAWTPDSTHT
jgi:hypothetical protein